MLSILSTLVLVLITVGIVLRRQRKKHVAIMSVAFLIDLGLVLYIELNRGAIEQAIAGVEGLLLFHILVSTMVLVLYAVLIVLGVKVIQNQPRLLLWHRRLAYLFVLGRLTNYVTSFFIV